MDAKDQIEHRPKGIQQNQTVCMTEKNEEAVTKMGYLFLPETSPAEYREAQCVREN